MVEDQLAGMGVEIEQLAVASPVDRDAHLLAGLVLGEAAAEKVQEEVLAQVAVLGRRQGVVDGADERCALAGPPGEDLLRLVDVGRHEHLAVVGDLQVRILHSCQAQQLRRIDQWEQVVHFEGQVACQFGEVLPPASRGQDLEQAGHAADGGGRERRVHRRALPGAATVHTCEGARESRPVMKP